MNVPESDLYDQAGMVEAAARALSVTPWHLAPEGLRNMIRQQAERVLTAALAGRTVVELPEPDGYDDTDDSWWWDTHLGRMFSRSGKYDIERENNYRNAAVAMLAAAEHHKRLRLEARAARLAKAVADDQPE